MTMSTEKHWRWLAKPNELNLYSEINGLGNGREIFRNKSRETLPIPSRKPQVYAFLILRKLSAVYLNERGQGGQDARAPKGFRGQGKNGGKHLNRV